MNEFKDRIIGWKNSHLSIARHYGGIRINGVMYVIENPDDPNSALVNADVLKRELGAKKAAKRMAKIEAANKARLAQGALL